MGISVPKHSPIPFECKICIEMYTFRCVCYTCKQVVCCAACFQKLKWNRCPLCRGGPPAGNTPFK